MPIIINLDAMLTQRAMTLTELSERVGITRTPALPTAGANPWHATHMHLC